MRIYLVQHGHAKSKEENPERPLTAEGESDVRRVAEFAGRAGLKVAEIRHSGKRRAEQTAAILAEHVRTANGVVAAPGLAPKDDVEPIAKALDAAAEPVMLVGHLPFMARLAARLVAGDAERPVARFQMAGIVCLERDEEGDWSVAWMVTPDLPI